MRFGLISLLQLQRSLLLGFPKPEKTILLLQNCQASQWHFILCPRKLLPCSSIEFPVTSPVSNVNSRASYLATTLVTFPLDHLYPFVQLNRGWQHHSTWFRCYCRAPQLGERHNSKKSASVGTESGQSKCDGLDTLEDSLGGPWIVQTVGTHHQVPAVRLCSSVSAAQPGSCPRASPRSPCPRSGYSWVMITCKQLREFWSE